MARIIVRGIKNVTSKKGLEHLCFQRGDIVEVLEDGADLGSRVVPPRFYVVEVPDVPAAKLKYLKEPDVTLREESLDTGERVQVADVNAARKHRIDLDGDQRIENKATRQKESVEQVKARVLASDAVVKR